MRIMISFDDFKKMEITMGKILSAEKIADTDKLLKLKVHFGTKLECVPQEQLQKSELNECDDVRQVVSGIVLHFPDPEKLVGLTCAFVTNLEPRNIKGLVSEAMILALGGDGEPFSLLVPNAEVSAGTKAR